MASISSDTFYVTGTKGGPGNGLDSRRSLKDHGRKHRTRNFVVFFGQDDMIEGYKFAAERGGFPIRLPRKMAAALWHAAHG